MRYSQQMNSRSGFLSLPGEILHEILRHSSCEELLKCRLVCSSLNRIIECDSELLYIIELFKHKMVDCGDAITSHAERLCALRDSQQAWRDLEWKSNVNVDVQGYCTAYELVGGVFAKTNGEDMFLAWLPSAKSPGYTVYHEDIKMDLRDFAIDPTQDLIVLLEEDDTVFQEDLSRNMRLHLRTMSTMGRHPKAQEPELRFSIRHRINTAFVQIASDVLAVFLTLGFQTRLILWNWEADQLLSDSDENQYPIPPISWDFALISPRAFMITTIDDDGAILLYKFSCADDPIPVHVVTLRMPPLLDDRSLLFLSSHSGPFLAKPPHGTEFTTGPDSRVQTLSVGYRNENMPIGSPLHFGFFYVHNRSLETYIKDYGRIDGSLGKGRNQMSHATEVPWHEWGPGNTRFSTVRSPTHWLRYVQGERVVQPPESHDGHNALEVWDFNVLPGQHEETRRSSRNNTSTMVAASLFREPLITSLPYQAQVRMVNEEYGAFMIDEERIVALKVNPANKEEIVGLHVYCF
ncbi:hypothetical protein F5887DRAFT_1202729 [Amanita rubescens]|nr:hypothetical protein F5887DRAFT_1202729 [Amanita rubescens]